MKKLILSLMIVLGTVLGVQAQTFDFSCGTFTESSFLPVADGFTTTQIGELSAAGYAVSTSDNGVESIAQEVDGPRFTTDTGYSYNYNGIVNIFAQHGVFYDDRDDSTPSEGPFDYRIISARGVGSVDFTNDATVAITFLLNAAPTPAQ